LPAATASVQPEEGTCSAAVQVVMSNESLIEAAIGDRRLIEFLYRGLRRVAEPHMLGLSKGGLQLLAYQVAGESSSGGLPEWRRFHVRDIQGIKPMDQRFGPRQVPGGKHASFDAVILFVDEHGEPRRP
jgi:hypothetical protein